MYFSTVSSAIVAIKAHAHTAFQWAKNNTATQLVGEIREVEGPVEYLTNLEFGADENHMPLQAADLLAYEWRKRISDARLRPGKAIRKSYERIRGIRSDGALWRWGREVFDEALLADDQSTTLMHLIADRPPTHFD